ncbi:sortase [Candidatus Peregrinibacteria bacterium]|nr:sortase [Candidatus Peregrinibacteria bacterium]
MSPNPNHQAKYDENGNIILPGKVVEGKQAIEGMKEKKENERIDDRIASKQLNAFFTEELPAADSIASAIIPANQSNNGKLRRSDRICSEESAKPRSPKPAQSGAEGSEVRSPKDSLWQEIAEDTPEATAVWRELREKMFFVTSGIVQEGSRQYITSFHDGRDLLSRISDSAKHGTRRTWAFLTQPVWVPGRKNTPKKYSRGTLFVLDIVRFGGTFAFLFVTLFVSLNYQSFWEIMKSRIDPLNDAGVRSRLEAETQGTLADKLKRVPGLTVAGRSAGDLLSFLPEVGPPVPTLIIPKLGLNVPIVLPSTDSLLKEDWKQLEEDIQASLADGVVHYPGTARPGQAGNFFITGHSSYFPWAAGHYKSVFARLHELEKGDEYWVFYGGDKFRYRIIDKREVKPSDVTVLDQPMNKRLSVLMTCTPIGTTLRRLIIEAQEVDTVKGDVLKPGEHGSREAAPKVRVEMLPI